VDFVAIDFETANADLASICQVGIVKFRDGVAVDSWESFIDPDDYFDDINSSIHGINPTMVNGAPRWPHAHKELAAWMEGSIVVCHTSFDRVAFHRACVKHELYKHECDWLDSSRVVRRAWNQFSHSGYGLRNVANHLGIDFQHHNAKEDARAAGEILVRALQHSGHSVTEWLLKSTLPISEDASRKKTPGDPTGSLFQETLVFTGSLVIPRIEAAEMAAAAGCNVDPGVTKRTTILVVGDQDIHRLNGKDKSSKHRKAEELIRSGQSIRILSESDFEALVNSGR
jgi:DNA polymerase-3 subunit epsilon